MQVKVCNPNLKPFSDIKVGCVFQHPINEKVYMKIHVRNKESTENCVDVRSGITYFTSDTQDVIIAQSINVEF